MPSLPCSCWSVLRLECPHGSHSFHEFLQTCSENETESIFELNAPSLDQNPAFHSYIVLCGLNVVLKRFRFVWVVFWKIQWLDNKLPWISKFELSWALWDGYWSKIGVLKPLRASMASLKSVHFLTWIFHLTKFVTNPSSRSWMSGVWLRKVITRANPFWISVLWFCLRGIIESLNLRVLLSPVSASAA